MCSLIGVGDSYPNASQTGRVPAEPRAAPLTLEEATQAGVIRGQLCGPGYRRLGAGLHGWVGLKDWAPLVLAVIVRRLPAGAAFSARRLHGCMAWTYPRAIPLR